MNRPTKVITMPTILECPGCRKKVKVPDEYLGKQVRCSDCEGVFVAEKSKALSAKRDSVPADDGDDDAKEQRPAKKTKSGGKVEAHRGMLILGLGIGSLVLPIILQFWVIGAIPGILAWIWGKKDLAKMDNGEMDPEGRSMTSIGKILGLVGIIINALGLLGGCAVLILWIILGAALFSAAAKDQAPPKNFQIPKQSSPRLVPLGLNDCLPQRLP